MKRKFFNLSSLGILGAIVFGIGGLTACDNASVGEVPLMKLASSSIDMNVGETQLLKLSIQKSYKDFPVRWFSSNENVAYFRQNNLGYVTAVGEGTATVTASCAGAYVDCVINVTDDGGDPNAARFALSPQSVTLGVGDTKDLTYTVTPKGTTVEFTSSAESVATVDASGVITAVGIGTAVITGNASNGLTKVCQVTVNEAGGGEDANDIGVKDNLGYSGTLSVGAPEKQMTFIQGLLKDFNRLTNSSITFQVTQVEEGKGGAQFVNASAAPAVFPFASDQIIDFKNLNALTPLRSENIDWIVENMLDDASTAARIGSTTYGYPFTSDNGAVMFYDKSKVSDESEINTFTKLFNKATSFSPSLEVDFKLTEGFYAAGALHTYADGKSLYKLTATTTGYKSSSTFDSDQGMKAIKKAYHILKNNNEALRFADGAPGTSGVLATIVDTSYVESFKKLMGDKYAVAPLPFVDDEETTRMGSYLGYKFYGVNATLDSGTKDIAHDVAKFLVSSYAQNLRYQEYRNKPTMKSLQAMCANEPHIKALNKQSEDKATVLLTAAGSELWSAASTALQRINDEDEFGATDVAFKNVLADLDASLTVKK